MEQSHLFSEAETNATKALKKFLSDIAEEYEEVLIENQIRHETSAPYSPHQNAQNGTAERNWRTLFDMARAMLIESDLPERLWKYAVMTAAHIRNRVYNQRIKDTPYNKLTGKKPLLRLPLSVTRWGQNFHRVAATFVYYR